MNAVDQLNNALAGRYTVERQIGQGGMATVFLARDVRHERRVAVKVLSPELGAVVGKERFLAEIRVTANLQHPHLLPLFDSGEAEGQLFYVMPYVDGESLRDRLTREKQLPVDEALRIASAVGGALQYAHRHGVIHRDLKPENILLQEGQPLVADFGIALAVSVAGGARVTQTGISLGTPHYMSPEQATGDRAIDGRTDIYSLGAVTYEMLTGEPPHTGSTAQAIIAKVLTDKPRSIRLTRETIPRHVEAAVECALAKLPADRFATAQEFVEALRGTRAVAIGEHDVWRASASTDSATGTRRRRTLALALPWALLAAVALALLVPALNRPALPRPVRLVLDLGDSIEVRTPGAPRALAISPNGLRIAFSGGTRQNTGIFVRELERFEARMIRGTDNGSQPSFAPDGRSLLFGAGGTLRRVDLDGSGATVSDLGTTGWSWGDNGVVLLYVPGAPSALFQTTSNGGTPRRVVAATGDPYITFQNPHLLPGSRSALLTLYRSSVNAADARVGAVRLEDGEIVDLGVAGFSPRYVDGYLIFVRADGVIAGAKFDARRLRLTSPVVQLVDQVLVRQGSGADFDVSQSGTLVYRTGFAAREVVAVSMAGRATPVMPILRESYYPRYSPDGRRIAMGIVDPGRRPDTWILDRQSGALTRLTLSGGDRPEWTPDGRSVLTYRSDSAGSSYIERHLLDGGSAPAPFTAVRGQQVPEIAMPRGGRGFLAARVGGPLRDISIAPVDSPMALRPFVATPAEEMHPSVSPDGRWLAYVSNESGRQEVYVRPMPGPGGRIQVSAAGGTEPMWSPRGDELFYRGSGKIIRARVTLGANPDVVREELFDDVYQPGVLHQNYDVSPDGRTLLFTRSAGPELKLVVVLNWLTEVRERIAAADH